jgi:protein TonB
LSVLVHATVLALFGSTTTMPMLDLPGPKGGSIAVSILGAPGSGGPVASAPQAPPAAAAPQPIPVPPPAPVEQKVEAKKELKIRPRAEVKRAPVIKRKRSAEQRATEKPLEAAVPPPEAQTSTAGAPSGETPSAVAGIGGGGGGGGSPGTGGGIGGGHGSGSGQIVQPKDSRWTSSFLDELRRQLEARKRYPRSARVRREEGTVVLRVVLSSSGAVRDWQIAEASPFPALDDAALDAARGIQSLRGRGPGGAPVEVSVVVPMRFSLNSLR